MRSLTRGGLEDLNVDMRRLLEQYSTSLRRSRVPCTADFQMQINLTDDAFRALDELRSKFVRRIVPGPAVGAQTVDMRGWVAAALGPATDLATCAAALKHGASKCTTAARTDCGAVQTSHWDTVLRSKSRMPLEQTGLAAADLMMMMMYACCLWF